MKLGRKPIKIVPDMKLPKQKTDTFVGHLKGKKSVIVDGLGKFELVRIKPRTLFHNKSKQEITTKAYNKVKYTPSIALKKIVNTK